MEVPFCIQGLIFYIIDTARFHQQESINQSQFRHPSLSASLYQTTTYQSGAWFLEPEVAEAVEN